MKKVTRFVGNVFKVLLGAIVLALLGLFIINGGLSKLVGVAEPVIRVFDGDSGVTESLVFNIPTPEVVPIDVEVQSTQPEESGLVTDIILTVIPSQSNDAGTVTNIVPTLVVPTPTIVPVTLGVIPIFADDYDDTLHTYTVLVESTYLFEPVNDLGQVVTVDSGGTVYFQVKPGEIKFIVFTYVEGGCWVKSVTTPIFSSADYNINLVGPVVACPTLPPGG